MSHSDWKQRAKTEVAIDAILDAAGQTFASDGVGAATMIDIAGAAGCSRATLYRYFPNREALQLAFVNRAVLRIAVRQADKERATRDSNSGSDAGRAAVTQRILDGIAAVREDPLLICWVDPENLAIPLQLSQNSELLRLMAETMVDELSATPQSRLDAQRRGAWMLRSIVSLLAMPGPDAETERIMVEEFIVPLALPQAHRAETNI